MVPPGLGRLFSSEMCCEISWLLPVAPLVMAFGIYPAIRRGTNALSRNTEAALVMWAGWLVVTALVFIYMGGTIHPYDTVALSPAIAALVGIAAGWAWS